MVVSSSSSSGYQALVARYVGRPCSVCHPSLLSGVSETCRTPGPRQFARLANCSTRPSRFLESAVSASLVWLPLVLIRHQPRRRRHDLGKLFGGGSDAFRSARQLRVFRIDICRCHDVGMSRSQDSPKINISVEERKARRVPSIHPCSPLSLLSRYRAF